MTSPTSAVVICAYTMNRWDDLSVALRSVAAQSVEPDEIWLVVDHSDELLTRARLELAGVHSALRVVPNRRKQGLSGARNTALEHTSADLVAFLDDDATPSADWLELLLDGYADPDVIAVGGAAAPLWSAGHVRPALLPVGPSSRGELDWVVGCTYEGQPTVAGPVRNLMGCNMSFRRTVFAAVGGFREDLGRVGRTPLGCEETELCIRASRNFPGSRIVFEPAALVRHHVTPDRSTWSYLRHRCYAEGLSKAAVAGMVGSEQALSTERDYVTGVLPRAVVRELAGAAAGRAGLRRGLVGAAAIVLALAATGAGYVRGRLSARSAVTATAAVSGLDLGQHPEPGLYPQELSDGRR